MAAVLGGRLELTTQLVPSAAWLGWGMGIGSLLVLRGHAASTVAALLLVVPAVTAIASAPALGETLHPASLAGMLVAIAGVGTVVRREAAPAARTALPARA